MKKHYLSFKLILLKLLNILKEKTNLFLGEKELYILSTILLSLMAK